MPRADRPQGSSPPGGRIGSGRGRGFTGGLGPDPLISELQPVQQLLPCSNVIRSGSCG
ncbi:MAG: hypothetical protein CM15mP77_3140 [Synechococcus sp.]|nr:MAG: hypothetical protein CM15mP77_3140 [Synechococcus sp.]